MEDVQLLSLYVLMYHNLVKSALGDIGLVTCATSTVCWIFSSDGGLYTNDANKNRRNPHIFSIINHSIIRIPIVLLS